MALELFHFKGADGADFTLPKRVTAGDLRKVRSASNEMDMFFTLVENKGSKEAVEALDTLDLADFLLAMKEWMQGATAPNSSSSSK